MNSPSAEMLAFVPVKNPIHRINPQLLEKLRHAQGNSFGKCFASAKDVLERAASDAKIEIVVPRESGSQPPDELADVPFQGSYGAAGLCSRSRESPQRKCSTSTPRTLPSGYISPGIR